MPRTRLPALVLPLLLVSACVTEEPGVTSGPDDDALGLLAPANCADVFDVAAGQDITVSWANKSVGTPVDGEHGQRGAYMISFLYELTGAEVRAQCGSYTTRDDWPMTQPLGSVDVDEGYSEGVVPADHLPDEGGAADLTVVVFRDGWRIKLLPTASSTVTFVEIP